MVKQGRIRYRFAMLILNQVMHNGTRSTVYLEPMKHRIGASRDLQTKLNCAACKAEHW